jgi:outer membrane protein OmpA-like peptidoglycan-associated protein
MRIVGGLFSLLLCLTSGAEAQVSVDMHALDSLGPASPARPAPAPVRRPAPPPAPVAANKPSGATAPTPQPNTATQDHASPRPSTATAAPPPVPAVPVPALPTTQPAMPPPSTTVAAPAPTPLPLPPPVRLVFDEGKTELTPADEATIRDLARSIPLPAADSVNVVAYAAGKPDDPSTARRLSLSRGIAVRSVLLASGVPSAQIYVRALGSTASEGPADRVELIVTRIGTATR